MSFFDHNLWSALIDRFIIQLLLIVFLSRFLHFFLAKAREPMVVAEMIAGILLGPSAFGRIPGFTNTIFPPASLPALNLVALVGLLLFLFIVGLEVDSTVFRRNIRQSSIISICGICVPFGVGCLIALLLYHQEGSSVSLGSFLLFIGVAMSITAFPVLARILIAQDLSITRVGVMTLSAAAVDDLVAWCLLALTVTIVQAENYLNALWTVLTAIGFIICLFILKIVTLLLFRKFRLYKYDSPTLTAIVLMGMFAASWITLEIGIQEIFGAFAFGLIVPREHNFAHKLSKKMEDLVVVFFLPLYFTYAGLGVDIWKLNSAASLGILALVIVSACAGKMIGCFVPAKLCTNLSFREATALAVLMNTKGLVELIVLNIGYQLNVINQTVYTMMVLMALCTTFLTAPLVSFIYPRKAILLYERANFNKGKEFSILLCLSTRIEASRMIAMAHEWLLRHPKNRAYAFNLMEADDRPSTYLKEWEREQVDVDDPKPEAAGGDQPDGDRNGGIFRRLWNSIRRGFYYIANQQGGRVDQDDPIAVTVSESAKIIGKRIPLIKKASSNMKQDLVTVSLARRVDLVILGEGPSRLPAELSGQEKRERLFGGQKISYVFENAKTANIAVMVRGYRRGLMGDQDPEAEFEELEASAYDLHEMLEDSSTAQKTRKSRHLSTSGNNQEGPSGSNKPMKSVLIVYYGGLHDSVVVKMARHITTPLKTNQPVAVTVIYVKSGDGGAQKKGRGKLKKALTWVKGKVRRINKKGGGEKGPITGDQNIEEQAKAEDTEESSASEFELDEISTETATTVTTHKKQNDAQEQEAEQTEPNLKETEEDEKSDDHESQEKKDKEKTDSEEKKKSNSSSYNSDSSPNHPKTAGQQESDKSKSQEEKSLKAKKYADIDDLLLLEALKRPNVELVQVDAHQSVVPVLNKELGKKLYSLVVVGIGKELASEDVVEYLLESLPAEFLLFVRQATDSDDHDIV